MSLTITKAEGVTVFTVKSEPKSKWPLFCQILSTLCCSSICSVSLGLKQKLKNTYSALGTAQIMIGLINLGFGGITAAYFSRYGDLGWTGAPFWLGGTFIAVGIICIITKHYPSPCLVAFTVVVNIVSCALAITAIVLYGIDLAQVRFFFYCSNPEDQINYYNNDYYYRRPTISSDELFRKQEEYRMCVMYKRTRQFVYGGLDIMMVFLSIVQLCIVLSWCALSIKALCKNKDDKDVEDPELHKPLVDEEVSNSSN